VVHAAVARVRLDGEILEGEVPPINKAVIDMHTAIYADQPEMREAALQRAVAFGVPVAAIGH
jgi:ribulose-5-phosphate 4-epimerase/fuculose-1-phosphate aldolase